MKNFKIAFDPDKEKVFVESNGLEWSDYLTALTLLAALTRKEAHKPERLVDTAILLATSRGYGSKHLIEKERKP